MMQRDGSDVIEHGPPPEGRGFGAAAIPRRRVRVMLAFPLYMLTDGGLPVAYVELDIADATQAVQAIRQAIADARKGKVRLNVAQ